MLNFLRNGEKCSCSKKMKTLGSIGGYEGEYQYCDDKKCENFEKIFKVKGSKKNFVNMKFIEKRGKEVVILDVNKETKEIIKFY